MLIRSIFVCSLFSTVLFANDLDVKIEKLKHEKDIQELEGSNEDVEGQRFMFGEWHQYAKEIEDVKFHQDKAKELQKEIDALEKQKAEQAQHGP